MTRVALVDVDGHNYPNLALMKISAWHKSKGDVVKWHFPLEPCDVLYASKVFTFSKNYEYFPADADIYKGGTGYDIKSRLPEEIEKIKPDYSIYPWCDYSVGFLSRGCPNHCPWCVVPEKEGAVYPVNTIEDIAINGRVCRIMDNNFLANNEEWVIEQIERMQRLKFKYDFNQALDIRRVTPKLAKYLAQVKVEKYLRFSCDTDGVMPACEQGVRLLRECGYKGEIFFYVLTTQDIESALRRIEFLERLPGHINPFVMPFRSLKDETIKPTQEMKNLARWCNKVWIRKSCAFKDYDPKRR